MPHYEFECCNTEGKCGHKFIVDYKWRVSDGITIIDDPDMQLCPECGDNTDQLFSLVTMRPDRFWAGVYDPRLDIYTTSESRHRDYMKKNDLIYIGDRTDREGMTKMAENGMKEKDKKAEKAVDQAIIDELAWKDEWGFTGTPKEIEAKRQEVARLESEDSRDVFIDPAFM